ncbi:DUF2061 domain-containing protein [Aquabacter sp. CN5-332]|uniref:DUF2061 domain-containing protein n=1 Tax=Aquabacter sp. CN5-332 TaxID=3156608 RepID=UPI0032B4DEA7
MIATARTLFGLGASRGAVTTAVAIVAGAALVEVALIPALAIGAAAVLAPGLARAVTGPGSNKKRAAAAPASSEEGSRPPASGVKLPSYLSAMGRVRPSRALMKTVTFRVVVTTLDFSTNYLALGTLTTAAGLSAFTLVTGPVFYFLHETGWTYFGDRARAPGGAGDRVILLGRPVNTTLAKTITYRTVATLAEFSASYVIVQDLGTALLLTSFGFVLGPFVYYFHERAWDTFGSAGTPLAPATAPLALPHPAAAI